MELRALHEMTLFEHAKSRDASCGQNRRSRWCSAAPLVVTSVSFMLQWNVPKRINGVEGTLETIKFKPNLLDVLKFLETDIAVVHLP